MNRPKVVVVNNSTSSQLLHSLRSVYFLKATCQAVDNSLWQKYMDLPPPTSCISFKRDSVFTFWHGLDILQACIWKQVINMEAVLDNNTSIIWQIIYSNISPCHLFNIWNQAHLLLWNVTSTYLIVRGLSSWHQIKNCKDYHRHSLFSITMNIEIIVFTRGHSSDKDQKLLVG